MTTSSEKPAVRGALDPDAMHAQLFIDPEVTDVTADQCLTALRDAGLAIDEAIEAQVNAALAARAAEADPADQAHEADPAADGDDDHPPTQPTLCLEGRPVVHGEDGRLEWAEGCDPERAAAESNGRADFYNLCRYVTVSKDQQIARLVAPTDGRAGHDLRGNTLQPRRGEPAPVKADTASVKVDDAGTCTALIDGVLHFDAQQISISPVLTVRGHVDFSTGNLRFDGDVLVDKGVRDRFEVQASGDVETGELIEAAVIRAGRDLRARGGVASKEAGELRVGRDLTARYLDGVRGEIGRDAYTEREIIQCRLTVGRELNVSSGAIIGGACTVAGPVRAATLGSAAAMPTTLVLGSVPAAERLIATLDRKLGELDCDKDAENVESRRSLLKHKRDQLVRWWDAMRRVDLTVTEIIHPETRLRIAEHAVEFGRPVNGPVTIAWNKHRQIVARFATNQPPHPIAELPGVRVHHAHPAAAGGSRASKVESP